MQVHEIMDTVLSGMVSAGRIEGYRFEYAPSPAKPERAFIILKPADRRSRRSAVDVTC